MEISPLGRKFYGCEGIKLVSHACVVPFLKGVNISDVKIWNVRTQFHAIFS